MLIKFRVDLQRRTVVFLAVLVLGIVLVMSPAPDRTAAIQEGRWLLPVLIGLAAGAKSSFGKEKQ